MTERKNNPKNHVECKKKYKLVALVFESVKRIYLTYYLCWFHSFTTVFFIGKISVGINNADHYKEEREHLLT